MPDSGTGLAVTSIIPSSHYNPRPAHPNAEIDQNPGVKIYPEFPRFSGTPLEHRCPEPIMTILLLVVLGGFGWYVLEPDERARILRVVLGLFGSAKRAALQRRSESDPFEEALRARSRLVVATPLIALAHVATFVQMASAPGSLSDPATLVAWGGNFGPNTSNGEWGRLVISMFVHSGPLHLLVNVVALVQVGLILERLVGPLLFTVVYFTAGILASVVSLYAGPVAVSVGSSGATSGTYGLLAAAVIWSFIQRSALTMPLRSMKLIAPVAAVFALYNTAASTLPGPAEWVAFGVGLATGLVLTRGVAQKKPDLRPIAVAAATAFALTVVSAVPLRGIANIRPELDRLVEIEERTAGIYDKAVSQFRLGALTAEQLARVIDRDIVPELKAATARIEAFEGVPGEQKALLESAHEYVRLRNESWRLRSEALHKADMPALRRADRSEHASLLALDQTKSTGPH
jgi:rhomboid protease GluP